MDDLESQIGSKDFDTHENIANLSADQEVFEEGIVNVNDKVDNDTTSSKSTYTSGTSNRKNISSVWQLFDKIMVDGALKKAKCKYCQVELTAGGNRGTSHLHKHATKSCPGRHLRLTPTSQTQLKKDGSNLSELGSMKKDVFNQDVSRKDLAHMVIMHEYWEDINGLLAVASILDPRNKMDCIKFYFDLFYDDEAEVQIERIRTLLDMLVDEYQENKNEDYELLSQISKKRVPVQSSSKSGWDLWAQNKIAKTTTKKVDPIFEVDHYLAGEPLPEDEEFDVLKWWSKNDKYPILRKIARDILAIPISTVASESAFSTGGRVVSPHRCRLHSHTVEALMCLQNWMTQDLKGTSENVHGCSTINEDFDVEGDGEVVDIINLDLDDDPHD
ncbi:unnamed protein product [Amaranthus hypochondriacus]